MRNQLKYCSIQSNSAQSLDYGKTDIAKVTLTIPLALLLNFPHYRDVSEWILTKSDIQHCSELIRVAQCLAPRFP